MSKPRGLLVADVPGWAFDINERDIAKQVPEIDWHHHYIGDNRLPAEWNYDLIFLPMHWWIQKFPFQRVVGALRSQWFDTNERQPPNDFHRALVNRCAAFQFCEAGTYRALKKHCPRAQYLTNPVDMTRFRQTPRRRELIACWNGNALHWNGDTVRQGDFDVKGLYKVLLPACSESDTRLKIAEYNTCRRDHEQMPDFYQQANVSLSASMFEGASNSVMEAMASGLAVIATDVGNHREMRASQIRNLGDSGIILVDRTPEAFAAALNGLTPARAREMGELNRLEIAARWSWEAWRSRYRDFFLEAAA